MSETITRNDLINDYDPKSNGSIIRFLQDKIKKEYPEYFFRKIEMLSDPLKTESDILIVLNSDKSEEDLVDKPKFIIHVLVPYDVIIKTVGK